MAKSKALTRAKVEEFLINEATLLDDWRLPEWRQLFAPDCRYLVPSMGGDPYAIGRRQTRPRGCANAAA